jgi:hypothetical protein
LERIYQLYAFLDIASNPPMPNELAVIPVDLLQLFAQLHEQTFKYDYDFQTILARAFLNLQDAHTRYVYPINYRNFEFYQPIPMISYVNETTAEQEVRFHPMGAPIETQRLYNTSYNFDLNVFSGAKILSIQGENALSHLTDFAFHSVGLSKDLGTRLNAALTQSLPLPTHSVDPQGALISSLYTNRTAGEFSAYISPGERYVSYMVELLNGTVTSVIFPWLAIPRKTYTGTSSFMADYYRTSSDKIASESVPSSSSDFHSTTSQPDMLAPLKERVTTDKPTNVDQKPHPHPHFTIDGVPCSGSRGCFELILESKHVHIYRISGDNSTAIMYLDTYEPESTQMFETTVAKGLLAANELGLTNLIIDLTLNGGGDICLGRRMLEYLFPFPYFGPTDMPGSPLADAMANAAGAAQNEGVWTYNAYTGENLQNFTDASWMVPGVQHTRGGRTRSYSQLLHLSNASCSYDTPLPTSPKPYFKEMKIVTRGTCGSTCAYFANHAALFDHVQTVVVGGLMNRDQQYTSFPGLQVIDTPALWQYIDSYFPSPSTNPLVPPHLTTTAHYRMCVREIYPHVADASNGSPTEYTFQKADVHLDNSALSAVFPEYSWFDVANLFA